MQKKVEVFSLCPYSGRYRLGWFLRVQRGIYWKGIFIYILRQ